MAGMLNFHQRGEVLAHSVGLLNAKVLVSETDLVEHLTEGTGGGDELIGDLLGGHHRRARRAQVLLPWVSLPSFPVVLDELLRDQVLGDLGAAVA
ncbi:hypothetical protein H7H37_08455, partial [Mycolicibacterium insubricum]|nr:hypothetical protein [Mycolicibacterium insubricum]